jgi:hypothetical protein
MDPPVWVLDTDVIVSPAILARPVTVLTPAAAWRRLCELASGDG